MRPIETPLTSLGDLDPLRRTRGPKAEEERHKKILVACYVGSYAVALIAYLGLPGAASLMYLGLRIDYSILFTLLISGPFWPFLWLFIFVVGISNFGKRARWMLPGLPLTFLPLANWACISVWP